MLKLSDIIDLPPEQRKRLRDWGAPARVARRRRRKFSRQELLGYMRANDIRSWRVLERRRADGDPIPHDYRREFGGWQAAVDEAFGRQPLRPQVDEKYVLRAVPYFDAWTQKAYEAARRVHPEVIPSMNYVRKHFKSFKQFIKLARAMCLKSATDDYMELGRKLGRRPTLEECRAAGLRMDFAVEFFRGKFGLDEYVDFVEGRRERRRDKPDAKP